MKKPKLNIPRRGAPKGNRNAAKETTRVMMGARVSPATLEHLRALAAEPGSGGLGSVLDRVVAGLAPREKSTGAGVSPNYLRELSMYVLDAHPRDWKIREVAKALTGAAESLERAACLGDQTNEN